MAKSTRTDDLLAQLARFDPTSLSSDDIKHLAKALSVSNGLVSARIAQIMAQSENKDFIPYLSAAMVRLIENPKEDKGCWGKEAICQALNSLNCLDPQPFLRGIRHVQMEPVWGGQEDTASGLRGHCAMALARMLYPEVHFELVTLLMDPTPQARQAAVSALSSLGCEKSELLLRMKALSKDETPELIGKCFTALIAIQPQRSIPFVAKFLSSQDIALAEYAAAALGESHERQAFEVLCDYWEINADLNFRKPLLLAISLTRLEEAFQFLLDRIIDDSRTSALAALEALEMYTSDDNRLKQIWQAVVERGDSIVKEAYLSQYQLPSS